MLAVRCGNEGIRLTDTSPAEGEGTMVRVTHVGICGSDLAMAAHGIPEGLPREITLGHEIAGETEDGRPVAIEPLLPCGKCPACQADTYNLCEKDRWLGGSLDGGMTERILVPERCLVDVPDGVSPADACLAEPLAVALHGLRRVGVGTGVSVGIVGAGSIGLMAAAAATAMGCNVSIAARHPHQRRMATRLGATVEEKPDRQDVAVAAAGEAAGVAAAVEMVRPHGRVLVLNEPQESFMPPESVLKEITVATSIAYARHDGRRDIDDAMAMLAEHPSITELITHRFPLGEAERAFALAADRSCGAIKVVLETESGINDGQ